MCVQIFHMVNVEVPAGVGAPHLTNNLVSAQALLIPLVHDHAILPVVIIDVGYVGLCLSWPLRMHIDMFTHILKLAT